MRSSRHRIDTPPGRHRSQAATQPSGQGPVEDVRLNGNRSRAPLNRRQPTAMHAAEVRHHHRVLEPHLELPAGLGLARSDGLANLQLGGEQVSAVEEEAVDDADYREHPAHHGAELGEERGNIHARLPNLQAQG